MSSAITKITIIGGDEHAWSAAARCLVGLHGQDIELTIVEDRSSQTPAVLALDSSAHQFHQVIGIQEANLIKNVGGSYCYGTEYKTGDSHFTFTHSPVGELVNRVHFHHYVARLKNLGGQVDFPAHSIAIRAGQEDKFSHPQANTALDKLDYTINLDRLRYVHLLRSAVLGAEAATIKVKHRQNKVSDIEKEEDGIVTSLTLDNAESIATDFVIDCSGQLADDEFESWRNFLPLDRCLSWVQESTESTPVLNQYHEFDHASLSRASLPGGHYYRLNYDSERISDQQALALAEQKVGRFAPQLSEQAAYCPGVIKRAWHHNVLNIGPASAYAGHHLFGGLYHTQTAMDRWLSLFPRAGRRAIEANRALATEYNRQFHVELAHVRDVHVLIGGGQQKDYPHTLQHRLSLFTGTGRCAFYESDVLEPHQWVNLLLGLEHWPSKTDPLINHLTRSQLAQLLDQHQHETQQVVAKIPQHDPLLQAIRNAS